MSYAPAFGQYVDSSGLHQRTQLSWQLFLAFLVAKPFIDLTWNVKLASIGGIEINGPRLAGIVIFVFVFAASRQLRPVCGQLWIIAFLLCHLVLLTSCAAGSMTLGNSLKTLLRALDAYGLYWLCSSYWTSRSRVASILQVFWLSTLAVNLISLFVWYRGGYDIDISQGVERYAGLYNDPGGPAYNAVICIVFAICIDALRRQTGRRRSGMYTLLLVCTFVVSAILLHITLTKNAIVMLNVFAFTWWGIYKKKHYLVLPLLVLAAYVAYSQSQDIRDRVAPEMRVFAQNDYSKSAISGIGTGRVGVWFKLFDYYQSLPIHSKIFGVGRSFGAHNQYLALLLRVGIVGLVCFLGILWAFFHGLFARYKQTGNPVLVLAMSLLCMFMAAGMTGNTFDYTTFYWYVVITVSLVNANAEVLTLNPPQHLRGQSDFRKRDRRALLTARHQCH